jgi:hypothetical protein
MRKKANLKKKKAMVANFNALSQNLPRVAGAKL